MDKEPSRTPGRSSPLAGCVQQSPSLLWDDLLSGERTPAQNVHTDVKAEWPFHMDMLTFLADRFIYLCPADDLPIFFVFGLLEHLGAADGLH